MQGVRPQKPSALLYIESSVEYSDKLEHSGYPSKLNCLDEYSSVTKAREQRVYTHIRSVISAVESKSLSVIASVTNAVPNESVIVSAEVVLTGINESLVLSTRSADTIAITRSVR